MVSSSVGFPHLEHSSSSSLAINLEENGKRKPYLDKSKLCRVLNNLSKFRGEATVVWLRVLKSSYCFNLAESQILQLPPTLIRLYYLCNNSSFKVVCGSVVKSSYTVLIWLMFCLTLNVGSYYIYEILDLCKYKTAYIFENAYANFVMFFYCQKNQNVL